MGHKKSSLALCHCRKVEKYSLFVYLLIQWNLIMYDCEPDLKATDYSLKKMCTTFEAMKISVSLEKG